MRKRINTPKLIGVATIDATCFIFPISKEILEKDRRKTIFMKNKCILRSSLL